MAYDQVDPRRIRVRPLSDRQSKHTVEDLRLASDRPPPDPGPMRTAIEEVALRIRAARDSGRAVVLAYGAHLVRNGLGPILIRMMEQGWITHIATNGAGTIHDWEYAYHGRSEEDVRSNVAAGCFGTWDETGRYIHLALLAGAIEGMGYGESLGRFIVEDGCDLPTIEMLQKDLARWATSPLDDPSMPARAELLQVMARFELSSGPTEVIHPHKSLSLTAAAYRLRIPLTVHPGIGYDIIYNHPISNGAVIGRGADIDYRIFVDSVTNLDGGVFMSVGSAIMAPQVFEKAISVANNLRRQEGDGPIQPYILVNDLAEIEWDWSQGEPPADDPAYYLRFCKSFSRMGGQMRYVSGDNRTMLGHLYHLLGDDG